MPYQNRVTPRSEIIATAARGMFMGNRGILHDETKTIKRHYVGKRWIICLTSFKGRRQEIMKEGHYTQLFFLDEATALAAGHRPCAECQRERFVDFRHHWTQANPELAISGSPSADEMDAVLHRERITGDRWTGWKQVMYPAQLGEIPDGMFVALSNDETAYLVYQDQVYPWSPDGYQQPMAWDRTTLVQVLTPRSIVRTLRHGYQPAVHPSLQSITG